MIFLVQAILAIIVFVFDSRINIDIIRDKMLFWKKYINGKLLNRRI